MTDVGMYPEWSRRLQKVGCMMTDVELIDELDIDKIINILKLHIMRFKFENFIIWQKAMDFGENIDSMIKKFPDREKFNLSSQILRAGDSIALNISESSIGQSNPEFRKFLGYSIRSLAEVVTCFHKAKRRNYIDNTEFEKLYDDSYELMNMLIAFKRGIK